MPSDRTLRGPAAWVVMGLIAGCAGRSARPVELFPEDMCARCRMAISERRCASEIITAGGEVLKFDDLACLETYRSGHPEMTVAASYAKDYRTEAWIALDTAVVLTAGVFTPMSSGRIAFADSAGAREFLRLHPPPGR